MRFVSIKYRGRCAGAPEHSGGARVTVKERGRAVETRRSARIFRLPAGPGGCAIILGPKKGGVKKGRVGLSKRPTRK